MCADNDRQPTNTLVTLSPDKRHLHITGALLPDVSIDLTTPGITILDAPPKSGKSWALLLAASSAHATNRHSLLLCLADTPERLHQRAAAAQVTSGPYVIYSCAGVGALRTEILTLRARFVAIDTLGLFGGRASRADTLAQLATLAQTTDARILIAADTPMTDRGAHEAQLRYERHCYGTLTRERNSYQAALQAIANLCGLYRTASLPPDEFEGAVERQVQGALGKGCIPEPPCGTITLPADWTPDQIAYFERGWEDAAARNIPPEDLIT